MVEVVVLEHTEQGVFLRDMLFLNPSEPVSVSDIIKSLLPDCSLKNARLEDDAFVCEVLCDRRKFEVYVTSSVSILRQIYYALVRRHDSGEYSST